MKRLMTVVAVLALAGVAHAATLDDGLALKRDGKLAEAEKVLAEVVAQSPEDVSALREWATVLAWLKRTDESIAAWQRALALAPDEPGIAMGLARTQYWKGELAPARERIDGLVARTPGDADALTLAGDISAAQRDLAHAREMYRRAAAIAPSPELEVKLSRSSDPPRGRFDGGGQISSYDTRGTEGSFFAQGSYKLAAPLVVSGGYEQLRQLDAVDHRLNLGAYLVPTSGLLLQARVAISPTADTIAPWEASGGVDVKVAGPLTVSAVVRHLDFDAEGVTIVGPGLRLDLGRWALIGQGGVAISTVHDLKGFGSARAEVAASDKWRLYAGFARGVEAQQLLPPATATDVVAGALYQINARLGVRFDYDFQDYGDLYQRHSFGSALTVQL